MTAPQQTLSEAATRALRTEYARLAGARVAFLGDPGEVEPLHDLRIALRRLRAALLLFRPVVLLPEGLNQRAFRPIGRGLAPIRDRDIALGLLRDIAATAADPERITLAGLGQGLEFERAAAASQGCLLLLSPETLSLLSRLERWLAAPRFAPAGSDPAAQAWPGLITPMLRDLPLHPGWWLPIESDDGRLHAPGHNDPACAQLLHELRRRARRTRYSLEIAAAAGGPAHGDRITRLHRIQDVLGALQDVRVVRGLLKERLGDGWVTLLPVTAEQLAHRWREAWEVWEGERDARRETIRDTVGERPATRDS